MLYSKLAFVLALASSVTAQTYTINDIPSCALTPALTAIGTTGCAATDLACVCKQSSFLTTLSAAIQQVCSAADYATTVTVATGLCLQNGVTLSVPPAASATSAASGSSPGAASGSASGSAPVASGSSSNAAAPTTTTASAAASGSNSGSATTTSKAAAATTNGAAVKGTWAAAGLLGVGALLAAL